jgi:chromosomal replication initiation ATPase DnaA
VQLALDIALPPSYLPEDVVRTPANAALLDALGAAPPAQGVLLVGEAGSGKTHLARRWAAHHGAVWLIASQLGDADIQQQLGGKVHAVVDDWEQVLRPASLVALINEMRARGGSLLVTSQTIPTDETVPLPDIRSRLQSLMMYSIPAPDDALLEALLWKACSDRQWHIAPDVLAYLRPRMPRSYAQLAAFIAQLESAVQTTKCTVTTAQIRAIAIY